jgi:DAK2 domain fusion protein YloV
MDSDNLAEVMKALSHGMLLGARGNSGVIISQFFRGFSECFFKINEADCEAVASALENGVDSAYKAVSNPTEGTVLTVLREATEYVRKKLGEGKISNMNEMTALFLKKARLSLEHTPELLPILKSAGVVDSGGAGIVYVFEGMNKYLNGETLEKASIGASVQAIDYSKYNRSSTFEFGYCTELLIQTLDSKQAFDKRSFKRELEGLGDSIVLSFEDDKVKLHIHTKSPEAVLEYCHKYGEFLTLKIENMSVQHNELSKKEVNLYTETRRGSFSVLAVAHDITMKDSFAQMGADIVLLGDIHCPPSAQDFLEAFEKTDVGAILVFANGKNTRLSAEQASKLYDKARVVVVNTETDTQCYSVLPLVDFECEDIDEVADSIREAVENIRTVTVTASCKDTVFDGQKINVGDLVAFTGSSLVFVGSDYADVAIEAISRMIEEQECDVLTIFASDSITDEQTSKIEDYVSENHIYTEVSIVNTEDDFYDIVLSFE